LYKQQSIPANAEILIMFEATDCSTSNGVQVRYSYTGDEVMFGPHFLNIVSRLEGGTLAVDYARFHDMETFELVEQLPVSSLEQ